MHSATKKAEATYNVTQNLEIFFSSAGKLPVLDHDLTPLPPPPPSRYTQDFVFYI